MKKNFALFMVLVFIVFAGCELKSPDPVSDTKYNLLNTVCTITIYDMPKDEAKSVINDTFELCEDYENMLSRTVEGSDIYRINNAQGGKGDIRIDQSIEISKETYEIIEKSYKYAELSDGKFDITVGKLAALWDFQAEDPRVPDDQEIKAAVKTIDYKKMIYQNENGKYYFSPIGGGTILDLGGIAKGYIADKATEYLENQGVKRGIVNLGGNVVAIGEKKDGKPWKIGIEKPFSARKDIVGMVERRDATVVTSGIYERAFEENGKLYHHILDVHTGYPVESDVEAVSIAMDKGRSADADALSSICLIIGSKKGMELVNGLEDVEASFILKDGEIISTKGMGLKSVD